jgi:hypothetical protein
MTRLPRVLFTHLPDQEWRTLMGEKEGDGLLEEKNKESLKGTSEFN